MFTTSDRAAAAHRHPGGDRERDPMTTDTDVLLDVEPVTSTIGAVVRGVELNRPLDEPTVAALRRALLGWKVLFLRDQHLDPTSQVRLGRHLGVLTPAHPLQGGLDDEHPEVLVLDSSDYALGIGDRDGSTSYNNRWHTDVTFSATPPAASILAAQIIPPVGGDTLWADLVAGYESLSPGVRGLLDPLTAVHDARRTFDRFQADDDNRARVDALVPVRHPVVRVHPETGRRGLFVNPVFTSHIEGLSRLESDRLLSLLYEHSVLPEHVVRWRWRAGDVTIWDNRSTSHYAAADYTGRRVMHRVTVAGDVPVGVTGALR